MSSLCVCGAGGKNTGLPSCVAMFSRPKFAILQQKYASDGTRNKIEAADLTNGVFDAQYFEDRVNDTYDKRWHVLPIMTAFTMEREDPITEDLDGTSYVTSPGNLPFSFELVGSRGTPAMAGRLEGFDCKEMQMYLVSYDNEIIGYNDQNDTSVMYGIAIETGTTNAKFRFPERDAKNRVMFTGIIGQEVIDSGITFIANAKSSAVGNIIPMTDVVISEGAVATTTSVTIDVAYELGGTALTLQSLTGLTGTTDFIVYNVTTSSAVTVTAITEDTSVEGRYQLDFAAQTASDDLEVTLDYTNFESNTYETTI